MSSSHLHCVRPVKLLAMISRSIVFAACTLSLCFAASTPRALSSGASIPLNPNTGDKPGFNVVASVGGGPQRAFLFDTGSNGLYVYPDAIKAYTPTTYQVENTYGSGIHYTGIVVRTTIDFGNGLVTANMPVVLVQHADCAPDRPHCVAEPGGRSCPSVSPGPDAGIACLEAGRRLYGTFGASLGSTPVPKSAPTTELVNPLFWIAQPWASSFSVTPSAITFGPFDTSAFTMLAMKPGTPFAEALPSGARPFARNVTICYTVGRGLDNACYPTLFDTGAANVTFADATGLPVRRSRCGRMVEPGTRFQAALPDGRSIADFQTGYERNWNLVQPRLIAPPGESNALFGQYRADVLQSLRDSVRCARRERRIPAVGDTRSDRPLDVRGD